MKKLLVLFSAFTISECVFAQNKTNKKMDSKMDHNMIHKSSIEKDCIMMEDGKMMVIKGGNGMAMDKTMTMKNGTMVIGG